MYIFCSCQPHSLITKYCTYFAIQQSIKQSYNSNYFNNHVKRWQQAIAANPQGFQNLHPQIQAKILAKIQAAKQRQAASNAAAAAAAAAAQMQQPSYNTGTGVIQNPDIAAVAGLPASPPSSSNSSAAHSQYPHSTKYFYSQTLNQIFHIQNSMPQTKNSYFNALR